MKAAKETHLAGSTLSITDVAYFNPSSEWVINYLWLNMDTFKPFRYFANFYVVANDNGEYPEIS